MTNADAGRTSKTRGAIILAAARMVAMVLQFVSVPILVKLLDKDHYGQCLFIISLAGYGLLVDIGFSEGGLVHLLHAAAPNSDHNLWTVWKTHLVVSMLHAIGALIFACIVGSIVTFGFHYQQLPFRFFMVAGLLNLSQIMINANLHFLTATRRFTRLAVVSLIASLSNTLLAVIVVFAKTTIFAYIFAVFAGQLGAAIWSIGQIRSIRLAQQGVGHLDWPLAKQFLIVGRRSFLNRCLSMIAGSSDRVLMGGSSRTSLTNYDNACRIPGGLSELSAQVRSTIQADIARAYALGEVAFGRAIDRYTRISLAIGVCFIVIPSTYANALLPLWLGDKAPIGGASVMLAIAVYRAFELYNGCHGLAMVSVGKAQYLFPAILWNAAMTAILTLPLYHRFGIQGVGFMNMGINILQLVPLAIFSHRKIAPGLPIAKHLSGILSICMVGLGVGLISYLVTQTQLIATYPSITLILIPFSSMLAIAMIFGSKLAACPEPVVNAVARWIPSAREFLSEVDEEEPIELPSAV